MYPHASAQSPGQDRPWGTEGVGLGPGLQDALKPHLAAPSSSGSWGCHPRPGPPCFSMRAAHTLRGGPSQQGVHPQVSWGPWFATAAAPSTWRAPSCLGVAEPRFLGSPEAALLTSPLCARKLPGGWAMVAEVTTTDCFCWTSQGVSVTLPGQFRSQPQSPSCSLSPHSGPVPALGTWADGPG